MHQVWNWQIFLEVSPDGQGTYLYTFLTGLGWTLATALAAWAMALLVGTAIGVFRTVPSKWMSGFANCYVELFRNIPLLVQMFLWYFVMPEMVPASLGDWLRSMPYASFVTAVVALGFYTSACVAVQVSAGIDALPIGQRMAGMALGLTLPQTYLCVLLPVAFRIIIPALTNDFTSAIKNTSIALAIGLLEVTSRARSMQEFTFYVFEPYAAATVIYVLVNFSVVSAMRAVEKKVSIPGFISAAKVND